MHWFKKGIFYMLSGFWLLSGCDSNDTVAIKGITETNEVEANIEEITLNSFFSFIQDEWTPENIQQIDNAGIKIAEIENDIFFLPYSNEYEPSTFIFYTKTQEELKLFENHEFLGQPLPSNSPEYKIWRKENMGQKILDISIEPHPILGWICQIRLREGE
ncbi:MAG: hypothetical protein H3C31_09520 [Brumimicrobium sp.]|nr:hypothetical protein [Brumimicrobium sp.]MCO5269192.1 hypothetical protein [Brumimicrobium sp.]